MRVRLKGISTATATLSNGERFTYHYAWRGGPRLVGKPGSPEFLASYEAAHRGRRSPDVSLFRSIITEYLKSEAFTGTRKRTQADYLKQIAKIEAAFGDLPLAALADPRVTKDLLDWRDSMAASPRQADYAWTVFMRLVSWARGRGLTTYRPPERVERLYHADRAEKIWTEEHVASFMAAAPVTLQRALVLALETGQRQGDLLVLPWSAYDGTRIRLRQLKTGRPVTVPVTRRLRAVLDNTPRTSPVILTNNHGRPWQANAFRKAWGSASLSPSTIFVGRRLRDFQRQNVRLRKSRRSRATVCATWGPSWTAILRALTSLPSPQSQNSKGADSEQFLQNDLQNGGG
jgi:integrase